MIEIGGSVCTMNYYTSTKEAKLKVICFKQGHLTLGKVMLVRIDADVTCVQCVSDHSRVVHHCLDARPRIRIR